MSRLDDVAAELRTCALAWEPSARLLGNVRADDIASLCDRYGRAIELLHMLDRPDARHSDVAAFLDGSEGGEP